MASTQTVDHQTVPGVSNKKIFGAQIFISPRFLEQVDAGYYARDEAGNFINPDLQTPDFGAKQKKILVFSDEKNLF